ncbi:MAG: response regulator [candidate division Zixibacteria bacterium]|nr:response regulator [candidate division Zixibacteria bacterium]
MSKKILIIDDEADIRDFLTQLLEDEGYETATADDGLKGLDKAKEFHPDLITLDLQMPNDTGTAFYRKIHRDKDFGATPVIVISGIAGRHLAIREPLAVMDKPIDKAKLLETIKSALN